jgi:hypothetical protein
MWQQSRPFWRELQLQHLKKRLMILDRDLDQLGQEA